MTVLRLQAEHLPQVAALERTVFPDPWSERALELLVHDGGLGAVILDGGMAVAYAGMTIALDEGAVTNVATHPDHRQKGYGEAVLRHLMRLAGERGVVRFFLEVRVSNAAAIALYRKLGFEIAGKRPNFYSHPREDAFVMTLE